MAEEENKENDKKEEEKEYNFVDHVRDYLKSSPLTSWFGRLF